MIKFVYFDLGGVVMLDFSGTNKWEELWRDFGAIEDNRHIVSEIWGKYEERICVDFDVDRLIPILKDRIGISKPKKYSLLTDFVNRFEQNKSIWPVIGEIHKQCKVGLLTNMYPRMFDSIVNKKLLPDVDWDLIIDSSKVLLRKPDSEMFKLAEEKCGFSGNEVLFIDNSQKNIDAAKNFNWVTFLYDSQNSSLSSKELLKFFKKYV